MAILQIIAALVGALSLCLYFDMLYRLTDYTPIRLFRAFYPLFGAIFGFLGFSASLLYSESLCLAFLASALTPVLVLSALILMAVLVTTTVILVIMLLFGTCKLIYHAITLALTGNNKPFRHSR
jgi:hypothetical protein